MLETTKSEPAHQQAKYAKKAKPLTVHDILKIELKKLYAAEWTDDWERDLPRKWKLCDDLLILQPSCFTLPHWHNNEDELWELVARVFKVGRVARENRVKSDDFRTPNLTLLYGNDPVVLVNNNGIKYSYNIQKCMFSWGNITEKLRIAQFDCSQETVVDLFAGIGYFTLVYLVHARASHVIACEWNPASCQALRNNLELNGCGERCVVLEGDNREKCPVNVADRVNLGLIPTSEMSWKTAVYALRAETGGWLHVHGNVDVKKSGGGKGKERAEWSAWAGLVRDRIRELAEERCGGGWMVRVGHVEYVKSYGPRVDHLVVDLECRPAK